MPEEKHATLGFDYPDHSSDGDGRCVASHYSAYSKSNACSYRRQAADRAKGESFYITDANPSNKNISESLKKYRGKYKTLANRMGKTPDLFENGWWPWQNQAHHIIPDNVLAKVLEGVCIQAKPNQDEMRKRIVPSLLLEPYNLNDKDNMVILPATNDLAREMGLPKHRGSHGKYDTEVKQHLEAKLSPKYETLAAAIADDQHYEGDKPPKVKSILNEISDIAYQHIIADAGRKRKRSEDAPKINNIAIPLLK